MTRGMPYSVLVHALVLVLVVVYGNRVTRRPVEPMHAIPFRLIHTVAAEQENPVEVPQPEIEPETQSDPEPPVETPPEQKVDLPPKEVPVKPPEEKKPEEKPEVKPQHQETVVARETAPDSTVSADQSAPAAGGLRVQGTDSDFPFQWYLMQIQSMVDRNWKPRQLGFGKSSITCTVHFEVSRGGAISGVSLIASSGIGVYDREALRAVEASRLPPLPPRYSGSRLGVAINFNLEPDY